jgi:hypothetical protein
VRGIIAAVVIGVILVGVTIAGALLIGGEGPARVTSVNAGVADQYARSDVSYLSSDHVFVSRLADGSFIALYDRSSKEQELDRGCRVSFDEAQQPQPLEQLEGFRGAFVEQCNEEVTVWRADGKLASGVGYGDLDRFRTSIDANGDLIVDITQRSCTRSRGVVGQRPFDARTCEGNG